MHIMYITKFLTKSCLVYNLDGNKNKKSYPENSQILAIIKVNL